MLAIVGQHVKATYVLTINISPLMIDVKGCIVNVEYSDHSRVAKCVKKAGQMRFPVSGAAVSPAAPIRVARSGEALALVRSGAATTIADLARGMKVARSTAAERVELLVQAGLLVTSGESVRDRGRPSTTFAFNPRAGLTLTAQIGVSGLRVAVTDLAGEVLVSRTIDVDLKEGPEKILGLLETEFSELLVECDETGSRVWGVGIGIPGLIELTSADARGSGPEWVDYPVQAHMTGAMGVPTHVEDDVNLLALGEHRTHWPDVESFICVKVGTVIGCGIVVAGSILRGRNGVVGEIGHTRVGVDMTQCLCGNLGCLTAVGSGGALAAELRQDGVDVGSAREVAALARGGHMQAGLAVRSSGRAIGEVLAGAINLLCPEVITVWGYLADAPEYLIPGIHESIHRRALPAATRGLQIEKARLGDDAGIRGAAIMVIEAALRPDAVDVRILAGLNQFAMTG